MGRKIIPQRGKVVIKAVEEKEVTSSGIIIARDENKTKETPQIVKLAVAGEDTLLDMGQMFNVGADEIETYHLAIPKYSGVSIEIGGIGYKVVEIQDVLALVTKGDDNE